MRSQGEGSQRFPHRLSFVYLYHLIECFFFTRLKTNLNVTTQYGTHNPTSVLRPPIPRRTDSMPPLDRADAPPRGAAAQPLGKRTLLRPRRRRSAPHTVALASGVICPQHVHFTKEAHNRKKSGGLAINFLLSSALTCTIWRRPTTTFMGPRFSL